ncbi:cytochrome c [Microvirga terricola]|uniref:C-type cytochrome n=1 Tax=Microvirga terricola TaxID=2719797 RepID=A0ABX0VA25_9HYPH|nr:cytochrome c [Microvirga terricola]NIX76507.1 c-type cytochrome [Microvirga terricola]
MRKALAGLFVLAVCGGLGFLALTTPTAYRLLRGEHPAPSTGRQPDLSNGRTLFFAGGCSSCHAVPGQEDRTRLGGGLALTTPFGTFHTPNISPHKRDGIGSWSVADFVRAMREGVSPEGEHYYPAFPYTSYQHMTPDDLSDLFAFLMTLSAVEGEAPPHELPFPFNVRRGLGLWKLAFLDGALLKPDPNKSPELNRGAYLVEGAGHCAECHSERNIAGAIMADRRFAGGPDPEGKGVVPNITAGPGGVGGWTLEEMTALLKSGETPNFDTVGGSMVSVVHNIAQLPESDRQAMAEYILSLPQRTAYKKPE